MKGFEGIKISSNKTKIVQKCTNQEHWLVKKKFATIRKKTKRDKLGTPHLYKMQAFYKNEIKFFVSESSRVKTQKSICPMSDLKCKFVFLWFDNNSP